MCRGYIYLRQHENYDIYDIYKLGRTINFMNRDSTYSTGEYKRGKFIFALEILENNNKNINSEYVEKLLQKYFKNYHKIFDGGIEFYNKEIINEIEPLLNKTFIKFIKLTTEEIDIINKNIKRQIIIKKLSSNINFIKLLKIRKNRGLSKENILRNELQEKYLKNILEELFTNFKVFIKAPTGFGKTHLFYKIISKMKPNKILIFTPRLQLNRQIVENKYIKYIKNDKYSFFNFSDVILSEKKNLLTKIKESHNKFILTSCYQSGDKLLDLINELQMNFDLIIFDESHFIDNWNECKFIIDANITTYKIFASATPTNIIETMPNIYGNIIEKIKIYELINFELLCNIVTLIKQTDNKKTEYHNLKDLIVESMTKYNKKKGIIYVNSKINAQNLYNLMKTQCIIDTYIYVSGEINVINDDDTKLNEFEKNEKSCIIIVVGKISYGYDNDFIDFICLGDPRQSDIEIRQILGRGLRWNKMTYPNKLLHLLIPLYKNEFGDYSDFCHLKKYLDYIIGECGQDIIIKNNGMGEIVKENENKGKNYSGNEIPIEILQNYCTTNYNGAGTSVV
jgi:superfamily II DNA or RNA helicase